MGRKLVMWLRIFVKDNFDLVNVDNLVHVKVSEWRNRFSVRAYFHDGEFINLFEGEFEDCEHYLSWIFKKLKDQNSVIEEYQGES